MKEFELHEIIERCARKRTDKLVEKFRYELWSPAYLSTYDDPLAQGSARAHELRLGLVEEFDKETYRKELDKVYGNLVNMLMKDNEESK